MTEAFSCSSNKPDVKAFDSAEAYAAAMGEWAKATPATTENAVTLVLEGVLVLAYFAVAMLITLAVQKCCLPKTDSE